MSGMEAAAWSPVAGLGPHGERPATPELVTLTPEIAAKARVEGFRVAIALHTKASDWSQRQVAGIEACLRGVSAAVVDIVDCAYRPDIQVRAIEKLVAVKPDAVIAIPVGGTAVASAFRDVSAAGIKLVLLDNAPSGLLPERDYVSVVSSDNFGLGEIAASLLAPHVPWGGSACVAAFHIDFFATAQREIAFTRWMRRKRPDIRLSQLKFDTPAGAGDAIGRYIDGHPDLNGLFIVWDEPAAAALSTIAERARPPAVTTVDLGRAVADALATGRVIKGVAAQRPFEQGSIAAAAAIVALTGHDVPPWIVLPGLAVTAGNVADAYRHVGGAPSSPELMMLPAES